MDCSKLTSLRFTIPTAIAVMLIASGCKPAANDSATATPAADATASPVAKASPAPYQYGTVVHFTNTGDSEKYRTFGWSKTEDNFTWSEGQAAGITVVVPPAEGAVSLRMRLAALTKAPEVPFQPVQVFVNDRLITEWQVSNTSEFTASLPADITRDGGLLNITLRFPAATSPKKLGMSEDPRTLGVSCFEFELIKTS
jgi:hypothetical protein